jgi:hypothetical protein
MKARQLFQASASAMLVSLLAACGGGSSQGPAAASTASISDFVARYNQGLASVQAMNNATFTDLFDEAFLDAGYTRAQLIDNLKQDSESLAANPTVLAADSMYPMMTMKDAAVSACDDASGVCTLTATYVNAAPDGTSTTTAVPVRFKDGKFRLYGDQKPS